jgi:3-deoxy-manno-octulosonate cytidylyltransferase (CMP-KDO synthetase)
MVRSIVRPRILGVIPARFASSRFPGKPLAEVAGKSILQHVFDRSRAASYITATVIATDDERIRDTAIRFGADVRMTRSDHRSGTDRAAEVAASDEAEIVVNIQGDEPLIDPAAIDSAVLALINDPEAPMATLKKRIEQLREIADPNVVKVVTDARQRAIYFSRSPIPHDAGGEAAHFKHIGLYVYRREFLLSYSRLPVGPLEKAERLEQLRALENGYSIRVEETEYESIGVDTPHDLEHVRELFRMSRMVEQT